MRKTNELLLEANEVLKSSGKFTDEELSTLVVHRHVSGANVLLSKDEFEEKIRGAEKSLILIDISEEELDEAVDAMRELARETCEMVREQYPHVADTMGYAPAILHACLKRPELYPALVLTAVKGMSVTLGTSRTIAQSIDNLINEDANIGRALVMIKMRGMLKGLTTSIDDNDNDDDDSQFSDALGGDKKIPDNV